MIEIPKPPLRTSLRRLGALILAALPLCGAPEPRTVPPPVTLHRIAWRPPGLPVQPVRALPRRDAAPRPGTAEAHPEWRLVPAAPQTSLPLPDLPAWVQADYRF